MVYGIVLPTLIEFHIHLRWWLWWDFAPCCWKWMGWIIPFTSENVRWEWQVEQVAIRTGRSSGIGIEIGAISVIPLVIKRIYKWKLKWENKPKNMAMIEYRRVNIVWSFIFHEILQSYVMCLPKYRPEKQHHTLSLFDVILPFGPEHVQFITQGPLPVSRWCWSVVPHGFSWGILRQLGFLLFLGMTVYHDCAHRIPRKLIHIFSTCFRLFGKQPNLVCFSMFLMFFIFCVIPFAFWGENRPAKSRTHFTFPDAPCILYLPTKLAHLCCKCWYIFQHHGLHMGFFIEVL